MCLHVVFVVMLYSLLIVAMMCAWCILYTILKILNVYIVVHIRPPVLLGSSQVVHLHSLSLHREFLILFIFLLYHRRLLKGHLVIGVTVTVISHVLLTLNLSTECSIIAVTVYIYAVDRVNCCKFNISLNNKKVITIIHA